MPHNRIKKEKSILRIREVDARDYYIAIDPISFDIIELSKTKIQPRENIIVSKVAEHDLVNKAFDNKINIGDLYVRFDSKTSMFKLLHRTTRRAPVGLALIDSDVKAPCIFVTYRDGKICFNINQAEIADIMSNFGERSYNKSFSVYITNASDYTKLYGNYKFSLEQLVAQSSVEFDINWYDSTWHSLTDNIKILSSNADLSIGFYAPEDTSILLARYRPQIVYRLSYSNIFLKSLMTNIDNYMIRDKITFFMYDVDGYVQKVQINGIELQNNSTIVFDKIRNTITKIETDHPHLYIENESNTHYRI